jgi:hypothetical protein
LHSQRIRFFFDLRQIADTVVMTAGFLTPDDFPIRELDLQFIGPTIELSALAPFHSVARSVSSQPSTLNGDIARQYDRLIPNLGRNIRWPMAKNK